MELEEQGFPPIALHFSSFMAGYAGDSHYLEDIAALLSARVESGDICLSLSEVAGTAPVPGKDEPLPEFDALLADLALSPAVGQPGEQTPLVLDGQGRLYLYRYWQYEQQIAQVLSRWAQEPPELDPAAVSSALERLFPGKSAGTDWQKIAALAAAAGKVTIVSGGPGTGKTTTVVKILVLLLEQDPGLRIALCAPTGKASARLTASIRGERDRLSCEDAVRQAIPDEVATVHRLLGTIPGSVRFRHGSRNPLPHDVVVVDEASMISLPLFAKLLTSLKPEARLILLGDRDQLASVEAGAVLGDIAGPLPEPVFSVKLCKQAAELAGENIQPSTGEFPLRDRVVLLRTNYRFGDDSGIAAACRLINAGDGEAVIEGTRSKNWEDLSWLKIPEGGDLKVSFAPLIIQGYRAYLGEKNPAAALKAFDAFRLLCALRKGPRGVTGMNRMVSEILTDEGLIKSGSQWFHGRPVMIVANDYGLRLFNGDIGLTLNDPEDNQLRVFFASSDGTVRKFAPLQLPEHETAFAMTVHKSQGSEFEKVLFVLPDQDVQVVTRELIYTGISRARKEAVIIGPTEVFRKGASRRIVRQGGLGSLLWGDALL